MSGENQTQTLRPYGEPEDTVLGTDDDTQPFPAMSDEGQIVRQEENPPHRDHGRQTIEPYGMWTDD